MILSLLVWTQAGLGSGPRYVTGRPYFLNEGRPIPWAQSNVLYYTDPGGLSAAVNHQAADALVASAAGVWSNVAVANIALSNGGSLAEHVSSGNAYLGPGGMVFPADVQSTNYGSVPIAVIYDTDGSVTDMLLGAGASSPSSCRQNGVTESVDRFDPVGYIQHAIIVLNGRCTGAAPQLQLQMQYQLERVFGRVLGVAWSQTNDNVLMGAPTPTYNQALNWPIMHPIDIICGAYTYQCLPNPFTLRPDDIASLVLLYPVTGTPGTGKQASYQTAQGVAGTISFPTGQGMAGVNMLVRRKSPQGVQEGWYEGSGVSGGMFKTNNLSPFVAADPSVQGSQGTSDQGALGNYSVAYIPVQTGAIWQDLVISTEAVNPLYFGPYSLQPFAAGSVSPSGSVAIQTAAFAYEGGTALESFTIGDAAAQCGTGMDGTAFAPVPVAATGWWNGLLCGQGHAAYGSLAVQPGRTLTVEVTALDEQGYATTVKAMPVIGVFAPGDGAGALPSVASAPSAFQARGLGTTTLLASTGALTQVRVGIADQRGAGRPDFGYQARVFYADSLSPATVPDAGGTVTISGTGFRQGNQVTVNGVAVPVVSAGANAIAVSVPAMAAVNATGGTGVDVVVADLSTGAVSTMTGALVYQAIAPNQMKLVTAQAGSVYDGDATSVPFAVQVVAGDGVTPVAGQTVVFGTSAGTVRYGACGGSSCSVATDANGLASTAVTPQSAGAVTMTATAAQTTGAALVQSAGFTAVAQDAALNVVSTPGASVTVGSASQMPFAVQAVNGGGGWSGNRPITFSVTGGAATLSGCNAAQCVVTADNTGTARINVTATATGTITLQAKDGDLTQSVSLQAVNVSDVMKLGSGPTGTNPLNQWGVRLSAQLLQGDGVTPDPFEQVIYSAPAGLLFQVCGGSVCALTTDLGGYVGTSMMATQAGTYGITIAYGAVKQTYTVTFAVPAPTMRLVRVPLGAQRVGSATNVPFSVQMLQADGVTPMTGTYVAFAGPSEAGTIAECDRDRPACSLVTDSNGITGASFIPNRPGPITISATFGTLTQSATFSVVGTTDVMSVIASPGAGTLTGDAEAFVVQVLGSNGVTPAAGRTVTFSVTNGSFVFSGCGSAVCSVVTDGSGKAGVSGVATAAGSVSVMAADGVVTQTMTFSTTMRPDVMRVVSGPAGSMMSSYAASPVFAVQVLGPDGVTPAVGRTVTFAVTGGSVSFGLCNGAPCTAVTDAMGMASTTVTALSAGATSVLAADGAVYVSDAFTAVLPDVVKVVSAPASGGYVGDVAATPFVVQVLGGDGVTPAAGKSVTFSVTNGSAGFGRCGNAVSCTLVTDGNGMVSSAVTPLGVGNVTLSAADGPVNATASFGAVAKPDVLRIVTAPANGAFVGDVAGVPLGVQVMLEDGVTAAVGKQITLAVVSGAAQLSACGVVPCVLVTDGNGMVSTGVTPLGAGTITLSAAEGAIVQSASFTAVTKPDVMVLVGGPADGSIVGSVAAASFSVRQMLADGVTPHAGQAVTFVGVGATLTACGGSTCTVMTDASGVAQTGVTPGVVGMVRLTATDGSLQQAYGFVAAPRPDVVKVLSVPGAGSPVGDPAAVVFGVQVLAGDGSGGMAGKTVVLSVTQGVAMLTACGAATCSLVTDGSGMVSTGVIPSAVGLVGLLAADGAVTQGASFVAGAQQPHVLKVLSVPADGAVAGNAAGTFGVQLLLSDGVRVVAGASVTLTTANGKLSVCGAASCVLDTDAAGMVSSGVTPASAGAVVLSAVSGGVTQTASFMAVRAPDSVTVVSAPSGQGYVGDAMAAAFGVKLTLGDGVTADKGQIVTFTVTSGSAVLGACGAATCAVTSDAGGVASTTVTPNAVGMMTVTATASAVAEGMVQASFKAVPKPDLMVVMGAPAANVYVGATTVSPLAVRVLLADGKTPVVGVGVTFSASGAGQAQFAACGAAVCSLVTDAGGMASSALVGVAPGAVTLTAAADASTGAQPVSAGLVVVANVYKLAATTPSLFVAQGTSFAANVGALATINGDAAGGIGVTWTGNGATLPGGMSGVTDGAGMVQAQVVFGPLGVGVTGTAKVCAWGTQCVSFGAVGVASSGLVLNVMSGGAQAVSGGAGFVPVVMQVTDLAGNAVAGAAVTISQTVSAMTVACPVHGRCPAAPVLASSAKTLVSSASGMVSVMPMTVAGTATETKLVMTVGTQAEATADAKSTP
ncbi:beta strand repeat-containing protein [Granulicella tundricola]|uniref:beta strand repeat-containing protein n=1 Tax=Granulicella tundricola TaxID=940615 RepID=UPI00031855B7|nr:IPT/TIG domain-containing protein [Granulicella tundricola]